MLQITGFLPSLPEVVDTDPYVPINIAWGNPSNSVDTLIYWRSGDLSRSLIEIGLDARGVIRSLTLVMVPQVSTNSSTPIEITEQLGLPICNIEKWESKTHYDDPHPFSAAVGRNHLSIEFENSSRAKSLIISGQTRFGIDSQGRLCYIDVIGLSENQISSIVP